MADDTAAPGSPRAAGRLTVLAALLAALALWGSAPLLGLVDTLQRRDLRDALGLLLHVGACGGGLLFAAASLRAGERLLAFSLLAATLPLLLLISKWALIAGGVLAFSMMVEAMLADVTGGAVEPYDVRVLAAAGASTLMFLLLLAGNRVASPHGMVTDPSVAKGVFLIWAAIVPGLTALYQIIRALLVWPSERDRRALAPLAIVVCGLLRLIV